MTDLTKELNRSQGIPFLEYKQFVTRTFFPKVSERSSLLSFPHTPTHTRVFPSPSVNPPPFGIRVAVHRLERHAERCKMSPPLAACRTANVLGGVFRTCEATLMRRVAAWVFFHQYTPA